MLKNSTMKRPAAAPSAGGKKHCGGSGASSGGDGNSTLKLGCKKCRGNGNGCEQCRNPAYLGFRLTRQEWKAHAKEHGLK